MQKKKFKGEKVTLNYLKQNKDGFFMSKLIIYFSLTGNNRRFAKELAKKENLDILEFTHGGSLRVVFHFMFKGRLARKAKKIDISNYDEIIIFGPIWGDKPAPAVSALLENLEIAGKNIECHISHTMDKIDVAEEIIKNTIAERNGTLKKLDFTLVAEKTT